MLNAGLKKEAITNLSAEGKKYEREYNSTVENAGKLHENKEAAARILKAVDDYIHSLSNRPEELNKLASKISVRRMAFEKEVEEIQLENKKGEKVSKGIAGAGVLAGTGVAAFGPAAAMGIATTFGTASTGTAIATLVGAAKVNAALAWLGGGALAAGGGGMAAGQAFLAMAGPVGWAIGGTALLGAGVLENSKNKKIAEKVEAQTRKVKAETIKVKEINEKVTHEINAIVPLNSGVKKTLNALEKLQCHDYISFSDSDKDMLRTLMNSAESLSERIGVKIA